MKINVALLAALAALEKEKEARAEMCRPALYAYLPVPEVIREPVKQEAGVWQCSIGGEE